MAVYYCHANNINLDNLGTDSFEFVDDNTMQVKLTDIWLNKHYKYEVTEPISLLKPVQTAPETFSGDSDKNSNIWTMGVILY